MYKSLLSFYLILICQHTLAKDIKIASLINRQTINCEMPNPMINLINDFHTQKESGVRVKKSNQSVQLGRNKYLGIQGYQHYKTKKVDQDDFSVNLNAFGSKVIKVALQGIQTRQSESSTYYLVFQGKPVDVTYHLRKVMGNDWNIENVLEETPQGNSKLVYVYAG